jgi:hypothetical protein
MDDGVGSENTENLGRTAETTTEGASRNAAPEMQRGGPWRARLEHFTLCERAQG